MIQNDCSVLFSHSMLWIPFHSSRSRQNFSYRYTIRNQNTLCSTSGQNPTSFGAFQSFRWVKIRPVCVLDLLHSSQRSKKKKKKKKKKDKLHIKWKKKKKNKTKIQVMYKAQVLPLKLTSSSLCLCHFQREKVRVWDFYEALNRKALECEYLWVRCMWVVDTWWEWSFLEVSWF